MVNLFRRWGIASLVFALSLILYFLSLEPTVSFWDCGEFIGVASGLQVSHPPGAPMHTLLGRIFIIVFGNKSAALAVNMLSAVASALTILLLYLTIKKVLTLIFSSNGWEKRNWVLAIEGASLIGAFTFAVSDSFWYSSVEAEVYALSSLFTALMFYLSVSMFDDISAVSRGKRVYLISLLLGISVGVHQLNLLLIPPVFLVIWLTVYRFSMKNVIKGLVLGLSIFLFAYALIPYIIFSSAKLFELLFVNRFGLFKWSGALFSIVLLFTLFAAVIFYAKRTAKPLLEMWITTSMLFIIGLSCYLVVPIRASHNVPLNTGKPDNIFSFWGYVQRDQYGSTPLVYGSYFNAPVAKVVSNNVHYSYTNGRYVESYADGKVVYETGFSTVFPRMYSRSPEHGNAYSSWASIPKASLVHDDGTPKPPTFGQNLQFFFNYQIGHMYLRYFMWNFVGRQNDIQGHGDLFRGGWITGFNWLDASRVGDSHLLPQHFFENRGRNVYFLVPLLLGIAGLIFLSLFSPRLLWPTVSLFILTGVAIVVFLNQAPYQPRERDYAFLGSFYVWSIWIGLGVFYLVRTIGTYFNSRFWTLLVLAFLFLATPIKMLSENWDDHNRSNRYIARNLAVDYLRSCAPNAILFTYGDNDTFPLWYLQEAQGFRTDVRVVNINYLGTGWGINQLRLAQHSSEPITLAGSDDFYTRNQTKAFPLVVTPSFPESLGIGLNNGFFPKNRNVGMDVVPCVLSLGISGAYLPSFGVNSDSCSSNYAIWSTNKTQLRIGDLSLLDIVASNASSRPIYFASTVPNAITLGLVAMSSWEGNLLRLNPSDVTLQGKPNLSLAITNLVDSSVLAKSHSGYLDDANRRFVRNYLRLYTELADSLIKANRISDALHVLDRGRMYFGDYCYEWNDIALSFISLYYSVGHQASASIMVDFFTVRKFQELEYYKSLSASMRTLARFDIERSTNAMEDAISLQQEFERSINAKLTLKK